MRLIEKYKFVEVKGEGTENLKHRLEQMVEQHIEFILKGFVIVKETMSRVFSTSKRNNF